MTKYDCQSRPNDLAAINDQCRSYRHGGPLDRRQRASEEDRELFNARQTDVKSPRHGLVTYSLMRKVNVPNFIAWYLGSLTTDCTKSEQFEWVADGDRGKVHA